MNRRADCRRCGSSTWISVIRGERTTRRCLRCVQFSAISGNARVERRHERQPAVKMTPREFSAWADSTPAICAYCSIPERLVEQLGVLTQVHRRLQRLGVDRVENGDYIVGSLVWACLPCNRMKGATFSAEEMREIARGVATVWRARLRRAGVVDSWIDEEVLS